METFNKYFRISQSVYKNELNLTEYKEALKTVRESETEVKAFLKTKTVKILKNVNAQLGNWTDSHDKKQDLINKCFDSLIDYFLIGRPISYFVGETKHEDAEAKLLNGTTAQDLEKFYSKRRKAKEEKEKAISNPETLAEFREYINTKGKDSLTAEQVETFERLRADLVLAQQQRDEAKKKEEKKTVSKINIDNVAFELYETKHSKTGADIFTVLMLNRVERADFLTLNKKAKSLNGYYSKFTDKNATPPIKAGFNFKTKENANTFIGLQEEDQTKPEAPATEETQGNKTAERMRIKAFAMIQNGEESLNQDRKANTSRRAAQAANAENEAQYKITFGKKLLAIAAGLENGTIKYLHKISNNAQLEQLEQILRMGFHYRTKDMSYSERQKEERDPARDVNFIKFPFPCYSVGTVKNVFLKYMDQPGIKRDIRKIIDYANSFKDENSLITLEGAYILNLFKNTALKISDKWEKDRILSNIQDYERIVKMGLINESILKTALRELNTLTAGAGPSEEEKKAKEIKELERSFLNKKIAGFFPTPPALIEKMFSMIKIYDTDTILEPSAGMGNIAEAIKANYPNDLSLIEWNYDLFRLLEKKNFNVESANFLNTTHKYDVILMNPPFENGQDIDHVTHAYNLLNPGGRLVAIMAGNKKKQDKQTIEFMELVGNAGYMEDNESGAFKDSFNSTNVNTVITYLEKN